MRRLKTIQKLTLATLLVLALSACSNKDTNDANATEQTTGTTQGGGEDGVANTGTGGNAGGTTGVSGTESTGTSTQTHTSNEESNANTETSNIVDVTPPVITLNGEANITLEQNENYTELGATAVDAVDGNVSVSISGSVDTATVGSYTVIYTAQDSAGNEASVSREVVVKSKYKILITRRKGNTARYDGWAYFNITLSHKPTHPVEIFIESDNPSEGIVPKKESWGWDMKTGRIVIHPKDWKRGEQIVIKGRNKNVINGKQDYHIITSPAVSEDPHFDGVDAEDVHMVGKILKIGIPNKPQVFFSGIEKSLFIWLDENSDYELYNYPKIILVNKPDGMIVQHEGVAWKWKPKKDDEGKIFHIKAKVSDDSVSDEVSFDVRVAKPHILKQELKGNVITITDDSSILKGVTLEVMDKSVDMSGLKVMTLEETDAKEILEGEDKTTIISEVFMLNKMIKSEIKLRVPLSIVPNGKDNGSIRLLLYDSTDNYNIEMMGDDVPSGDMWVNLSSYRKFKKYLGKDIAEFPFGGVRPFRLNVDDRK